MNFEDIFGSLPNLQNFKLASSWLPGKGPTGCALVTIQWGCKPLVGASLLRLPQWQLLIAYDSKL